MLKAWCGGPEPAREVLAWLGREGHLVTAAQRSPYRQVMVAGIPGRARFSWCGLRGRRAAQAGHAEGRLVQLYTGGDYRVFLDSNF